MPFPIPISGPCRSRSIVLNVCRRPTYFLLADTLRHRYKRGWKRVRGNLWGPSRGALLGDAALGSFYLFLSLRGCFWVGDEDEDERERSTPSSSSFSSSVSCCIMEGRRGKNEIRSSPFFVCLLFLPAGQKKKKMGRGREILASGPLQIGGEEGTVFFISSHPSTFLSVRFFFVHSMAGSENMTSPGQEKSPSSVPAFSAGCIGEKPGVAREVSSFWNSDSW